MDISPLSPSRIRSHFQPTPKMSSRPRQLRPTDAKSPPLTTSLNANTLNYPSPYDNGLLPKDGSLKLKVKSLVTPEARSRLAMKPLGARAPAPSSSRLEGPGAAARSMHRAITPSDSEGSIAGGWMHLPDRALEIESRSDGDEGTGQTEAVLVTVR